ncbi:MAG: outer membrane protein assembly factor BamA [Betaproteobacteria bacterium]|nr:outer membrane protein assembly factor BamA [Betaproteobacteria bacterium]
MKKSLVAVLVAGLFSLPAAAIEPFTVSDIRVEGIQRTEAGTVFSYLPVKVGDTLNDEKTAEAIKALFATGFFRDVRIEVDGKVMVVVVQERPAIAQIDFVGLKEFEKDVVIKALKEVGIAEGRIFDRAQLERAEQELKRQYLTRGKYAVNITTTVTPLERNRVGINFNIEEGDSAKIRQINIVGAKDFTEKQLLGEFQLTTPGLMTWYTKNDQYSRQKLSADLEKLKSFYMNRGYLEFAVDSTQVSISPDKKDIYITIGINEGQRYQVSSVKLAGDFAVPEEELQKLVTVKAGDVFSREQLNNSTKAIGERLGRDGYAFANVNAAPEIDKEKRQVAFTVFVDPGKRVYVRRINISGNLKTRDEVIRREMRQMEGGWYDADRVTLSKQRLDRLGFFTETSIETPAVQGSADQIDVNLKVTEKPTGNLMLGAGLSSTEGLILSGSISQSNFLGSGNNVAIIVNTGKINRVISFSYTNPYFTADGISQGFDLYNRRVDSTSTSVTPYKSESYGAGVRIGVPIGEKQSLGFGLGIDQTSITAFTSSAQTIQNFVATYGETNLTIPVTASWIMDGKDSFLFPTTGWFQKATAEVAVPGGDLTFYRLSYQLQRYVPLSRAFTLMLNGDVGYGDGYSDTIGLPFYKNFYAGGVATVRGYKAGSLGPRDPLNPDARLGGNRRFVANAELLWGVPGMDKSLRLGWFVDAGWVWGNEVDPVTGQILNTYQPVDFGDLRYSTGLSLSWLSPFGPLKLVFAQPINKQSGDRTEAFQFQVGTTF